MQSKRKSNTVVTYTVDGSVITYTVGTQSFGMDVARIVDEQEPGTWARMSENGKRGTLHGFIQKVVDRAAIGRDPETGASATPEEKFAAMKECAERLMAGGPWNAVPTGTGSTGGLLYRAMKVIYPNAWSDRTTFAAYIAQKAISESERLGRKVSEGDVRAGLMAVKKVAKEIERIRAEEGKATGVDAGSLLQELEG